METVHIDSKRLLQVGVVMLVTATASKTAVAATTGKNCLKDGERQSWIVCTTTDNNVLAVVETAGKPS